MSNLSSAIISVTYKTTKKHTCSICHKHENSASSLRYHIESVHKDSKHKCDLCDMEFSHQTTLKTHIKHVHELAMDFHCGVCDFKTKNKQYMKEHIENIHEGKKPYHCLICDSRFALKPNFTAHVAIVHEGKRTEKCETCHKFFSKRRDLKKHIASVHQVKKCALCEFEATSIIAMETHKKSIHEEITESSARGRPENMSELIQSLLKAQVSLLFRSKYRQSYTFFLIFHLCTGVYFKGFQIIDCIIKTYYLVGIVNL